MAAPKLTKLMQKALQEAPETTKFETIQKLAKMDFLIYAVFFGSVLRIRDDTENLA